MQLKVCQLKYVQRVKVSKLNSNPNHITLRLFLRIPCNMGFREAAKFESRAFGEDEDEDEDEEAGLASVLELELLRLVVKEDPTPPPPPPDIPPPPTSSKCDPFKDPSDAAVPNERRLPSSKPNRLVSTPL